MLGVAVTPLVLVAGLLVSAELRGRRLAERLIGDANLQASWHLDRDGGQPGSVAECLGRALDRSPDVSRDAPWMSAALFDVRDGTAPLESLPATALSSLTLNDPWLRETVACNQLTSLQAVPGLGPLADPLHPRRQALPRLQEALAALAPLRVRLLADHGQHDEALALCEGVLAVAIDLSWLEGPEAALGNLGVVGNLVRPCVDAVLADPDDARVQRFDATLERLERRVPPYAHVMALERVAQELRLFGSLFAAEQMARLPPGPQRMVATSASLTRAPWERVALSYWWRGCDEGFTAVIAAADRSEPSRTRDILSGQRHFASPWLRLLSVNPLDVRYEMYTESHDVLALSVGLVRAAVTARKNVPTPTALLDVQVRAGVVEVTPRQSEWRRASFTAPLRTPALPE